MAKNLVRQALGRAAVLGDLYDLQTDSVSKENVFESSTSNAIQIQNIQTFEFNLVRCSNLASVLAVLKVEGDLQLSVISGLCDPKGLASHLIGEAQGTASRRAQPGILFTMKTQKEMLRLDGESEESIAETALKKGRETHAVEEVTYGVNTFLALENKNTSSCSKDVDDHLIEMLKIIQDCFGGQPFAEHQKAISRLDQAFKIEIFSDLSVKGLRVDSLQHALEYLKEVPDLVKGISGGKGVPLSFLLVPITNDCKMPGDHQHLQATSDEVVIPILKRFDETIRIRLKVNEAFIALEEYDFCVSEEDLDDISAAKTRCKGNFKTFQKELAVVVKKVRAGIKPPSALRSFATEAEGVPYAVKQVEQVLHGIKGILIKLKFVDVLMGKGVLYVGKGTVLDEFLEDVKAEDVYVLHCSTEARKRNKAQWKATLKEFLGYTGDPNNTCVLADNDFITGDQKRDNIAISHLRNGERADSSDFSEDESDSNSDVAEDGGNDQLVDADDDVKENECNVDANDDEVEMCYVESSEVKPTTTNPSKKAYLRMQCPGAASSVAGKYCCSSIPKTWHCCKCRSIVCYGFDGMFYCACGNATWNSFRFLCNDEFHGPEYIPAPISKHPGATRFTQLLNSLEPLKELNILIMGETGVGKSTWINGFINYLTYDTMEEAEKHGPKYLIGSSFVMTDEEYVPIEIKMGPAENDNNTKGQSTTQMPSSYIFTAGELLVRLVDTPGVGDTRGIDQDKENFQNILSHLSHLEELHGICILLKSNSARLTITFKFCIKELLTHLHKDACKNILFVFTNARETFYRPGDTFSTLRNLLGENKDIVISLGKETLYCMDNESMRFLAATNQGMTFNAEDRLNYSNSWRKAVAENERLVQHILALRAHSTRKTLSLNEARRLILGLTEPLAQISQNIQNNIILAQNRSEEIEDMIAKSEDLKGKLKIPVMDLVAKEIPYPRTVCTSANCVDAREINGITKVNYKTWCHEHCYLKNVQVQKYPCVELQRCAAMNGAGSCNTCGCSWDVHMHLTYECVEVAKDVIDKNVEELLEKETDSIKAVEQFLVDVQSRIARLKDEQTTINRVASKCGTFLKRNAITPYNDSVDEYLQQCIRVQKDLVYAGASDKTLKGLERMLANYRQEVNILEMSMKNDAAGHQIGPDDIPKLIKELYTLPINGKSLEAIVDVAMSAKKNMVAYQEKVCTTSYQKKNFLKRAWDKGKCTLSAVVNMF